MPQYRSFGLFLRVMPTTLCAVASYKGSLPGVWVRSAPDDGVNFALSVVRLSRHADPPPSTSLSLSGEARVNRLFLWLSWTICPALRSW